MLEDIDFKRVTQTAVAIVPDKDGVWNAYLLNTSNQVLTGVLINAKSYGIIDNEEKETATFRYFFEEIQPKSYVKFEMLTEDLLHLNNEFWISFYKDNYWFDKKYVFVQEVIKDDNYVEIPLLNTNGVLIE